MAAFEINERKLERATSHLVRRTFEDDKRDLGMVARITAPPLLLAASVALLLFALLARL